MTYATPDLRLGASLLDLPEGVLRLLWKMLPSRYGHDRLAQHALRCTCKALKHTTDGFIHGLHFDVQLAAPATHVPAVSEGQATENQRQMEALCASACSQAMQRLARFPSSATATFLNCDIAVDDNAVGAAWRYHVLPDILPAILLQGSAKLAAVQRVSLSGDVAISAGELFSVATCCPNLQHLELRPCWILGPAFLPLARLAPHLRRVKCVTVLSPHGSASLHPSMAALTQLTALTFISGMVGRVRSTQASAGGLLPHISSLHGLRELRLGVLVADAGGLHALSALTGLTSLGLDICVTFAEPPAPAGSECITQQQHTSVEQQCTFLTSLQRLTSLSIMPTPFHDASIRMLASLPALTQLSAELQPSSDLSGLHCSWKQLDLHDGSAHYLPMLPLDSVEGLLVSEWHLPHSTNNADVQGLVNRVSCTAQLLARLWVGRDLCLSSDDPLDEQLSLEVLAALTPVGRRKYPGDTTLHLMSQWEIGAPHAHTLSSALPYFRALHINIQCPGLPSFVAALGSCWPRLRRLTLLTAGINPDSDALHEARSAFLQMAAERTTRHWELVVSWWGPCNPARLRRDEDEIRRAHRQAQGGADELVVDFHW